MSLHEFFESLFEVGHVIVPAKPDTSANSHLKLARYLEQFERDYRLELPGDAPKFDVEIACWAAERFFRACYYHIHREVSEQELEEHFSRKMPALSDVSSYSVDLTFRFLPDLFALFADGSKANPLARHIRTYAERFPLSSVGIAGIENVDLDVIASHRCLLMLYVDRILERNDASRLTDPRIREAVAAALGAHRTLSPKMYQKIEDLNQRMQPS